MGFSDAVWDRESHHEGTLSKSAYAFMVCFWTALGILSSAWAATVSLHWQLSWLLLLGTFVVSMTGVWIALKNDNPLVSLLGYGMITVPFGLMMGPAVSHYTTASLINVLATTFGLVAILGLVGALYPKSLEGWGSYLLGGLVALLLALIALPIAAVVGLPVSGALSWLDWIGIALFSALVVFDLNRAMRLSYTHDNAIDSAVAVYLDFANIFIRLLNRTGSRKD